MVKNLPANAGATGDMGLIPGSWQPTPVFLPGKSQEQRSLVGYSPWVNKESDTTQRLHFHILIKVCACVLSHFSHV